MKKSLKTVPRLIDAVTFDELADIIKIRSGVYPTNYIDFLLLNNDIKKLSEILDLYQNYKFKNKDFNTVSRLKSHISHRHNHDGWIFDIRGDKINPIVKLIGLRGKK